MTSLGSWTPGAEAPLFSRGDLTAAAGRFREPVAVVRDPGSGHVGVGFGGAPGPAAPGAFELLALLPPLYPEWLGDRGFLEAHGTRFPYVVGAMANGIATARMVVAAARAGCLGFFGAAGLGHAQVEAGLDAIEAGLAGQPLPWGANLIHSPQEPALEAAVTDLYLARGVRRVSASAYMELTPNVVRYAAKGLRALPDGRILRRNFVFAKVSRPEVARAFLAPPPRAMLEALVAQGRLTPEEAACATRCAVASDVTAEADSGGHTDNRPLSGLLPVLRRLRDDLAREHRLLDPPRVGAGGGLGTPESLAGAFGMGADYVLTGSVNQACVESGLSEEGRHMLCRAGLADVIMAPAADMFEMGVKLQVLRRETLFASRASKLYELYQAYASLEDIPETERARVEQRVLGAKLADVEAEVEAFWAERDPSQLERARKDPKHRMALVFRWYLGRSSRWAITGDAGRRADYQIWCGPAMGAFNEWVRGSFLEAPEARSVGAVALALMEGAAAVTRAQELRAHGAPMPGEAFAPPPAALRIEEAA